MQRTATMAAEDNKSPSNPRDSATRTPPSKKKDSILSPGFRSAAAMAGWDEEALLLASLVVEDTPVRESRYKKRPNIQKSKSPSTTTSNRAFKRRSKRGTVPAVVLRLEDDDDDDVVETVKTDGDGKKKEREDVVVGEKKEGDSTEKTSSKGLPCMDQLRDELSCAICLEICFEPSTTTCGHSFCLKCLKCAADKCGKRCPKCRQLISNGRSCTVNTVLWNTIQLLFPNEVEARRKAVSENSCRNETRKQKPINGFIEPRSSNTSSNTRSSSVRNATQVSREMERARSTRNSSFRTATQVSREAERQRRTNIRGEALTESEDAALAYRLQREEFMEAFHDGSEQSILSVQSARANLRAMASRAHIRTRGRYS